MKRYKIYPRYFGANTYLLTADDKTAVVIDPSSFAVVRELEARNLVPAYVLLTHCHFDHVMFAAELQAKGAKVVCLDKEQSNVNTDVDLYSFAGVARKPFSVDMTVTDGESFTLAGVPFTALWTAGHTSGSAVYMVETDGEKWLFTGDTLFADSIGRTDFPTGDLSAMRKSLQMLLGTFTDLPVYSGHGDETTLDTERKTNPFLADI